MGLDFKFGIQHSEFGISQRGITLLLVILILSSLLSISLGIFNAIFSELRLSGEIANSFTALYAADEAIERGLYLDRKQATTLCVPIVGVGCQYIGSQVQLSNGSCYRLRVDKKVTSSEYTFDVDLRASGEFRCGGDAFSVKRALQTSYSQSISPPTP
ncbi:MAG: hypothetical protein Q7S66_05975 [bacterium]|nr:hypothetical protein [bacterium]